MKKIKTSLLILLFGLSSGIYAQTVQVPVKLDYPLLRQLLLMQLFNGPDLTVDIANDPSGCNKIILSDPQLSEHNQYLQINIRVRARLSIEFLGNCTNILHWQGRAEFLSTPKISSPDKPLLYLEVIDIQLYTPQNKRITSGALWDYAKSRLLPLLSQFKVDLRPTIKEIRGLLSEVLPRHSSTQIEQTLNSLQIQELRVEKTNVAATLFFEIADLPKTKQQETALNEQEIQLWQTKWQSMDALITYTVKRYASTAKLHSLRDTLFEILIDARYQLQEALSEKITHANDPVRSWFINSWERLVPVLRKISTETPEQTPLALISLVTATDALHALDQLGPTVGLDISTAGLRRLARILNKTPTTNPLRYNEAIDPELRRLFPFPSIEKPDPTGLYFDFWPMSSAWAKTSNTRLNQWVPTRNELHEYLALIRHLLIHSSDTIAKSASLNAATLKLYRHLVLTTAWQESCWRQYVIKQNQRVPLSSGTGDVGIMQINERVWRGFYNIHKLRWDINYNVTAGSEVLLNYLLKYAIRKKEDQHQGGLDNLARATYSAYNGGPSQLSRYRKSKAHPPHKKIDAAFLDKYKTVQQGNELQVGQCLGAEKSVIAKTKTTQTITPKSIQNEAWIKSRNKNNYTLQLAVFSSTKTAQKFIHNNSLSGTFAIYRILKNGKSNYGIIYGQYTHKSGAEKVKQKFKQSKPWLRQFKDIQGVMVESHKHP